MQSGGFASQIVVDRPTVVLNVIQPLFVLQLNNESDVLDSADRQVLIDYLNGEVESRQKREANETNESESPGINLNLNQKIEVENEGNLTELLLGLINAPKNVANVKVQQYNIENAKFYQTQHFGAQETFNPSFNQIAVDNNPTLLFLQLVQLLQKQQNSFGGDIVGETSPQNLVSKSVDATENIAETVRSESHHFIFT